MISKNYIKNYIKVKLELYSCDYKKNTKCEKSRCKYMGKIDGCTKTSKWKYAKRTALNYIKRIINLIRGNW